MLVSFCSNTPQITFWEDVSLVSVSVVHVVASNIFMTFKTISFLVKHLSKISQHHHMLCTDKKMNTCTHMHMGICWVPYFM